MSEDLRTITWCPRCEWGLDPQGLLEGAASGRSRRLERQTARIMRRLGTGRKPWWGWRDVASPLTAVGVFIAWLGTGASGVALLVYAHPVFWVFGVALVAAFVASWPRPARPDGAGLASASPDDAPGLHALVARAAEQTGARPPTAVFVTATPIVASIRSGFGRSSALVVGVSLWGILDSQARVAAIARALSETAGRDPRRFGLVALAGRALVQWRRQLGDEPAAGSYGRPTVPADQLVFVDPLAGSRLLESSAPEAGRLGNPATGMVHATYHSALRAAGSALARLSYAGHVRAEFRSDARAASAAGTGGLTGLLDVVPLLPRLSRVAEQALARREGHMRHDVVEHIESLPEKERDRLARVAARVPCRVEDRHPPVRLRRDLLRRLGDRAGSLSIDRHGMDRIDAEIDAVFEPVELSLRAPKLEP